jgi:PAS domain S-box-containing protein
MKERKQSIEFIKKQGLNAFLDYASVGIILVDSKMEIILVNRFVQEMFGYTKEELQFKKIDLLIPARFHANHDKHQARYFEHPQNRPMGLGMDLYAVKKDGTEFPVEVSLGTYKIGDEVFVISFVNDITLRKENEASIKRLNAELEKKVLERTEALAEAIVKLQNQIKETEEAESELAVSLAKEKELGELKSRFVSMASHEFRTPLSTINSSAYLLQKYNTTEDQPKREKHLERIISSVNTMTDILEDFLSVGKMEEGKVIAKIVECDIQEQVNHVINQMKPIVKEGQEIHYSHVGPVRVWADPSLMKHICLNLLSNAVKFSPPHQAIQVRTDTSQRPWVLIVEDQGIGISQEDQKYLYDRFYRGANASNIQGTGLGLHIVSKYTGMMDGTITCESELNVGTRFILRFP